MRTAVRALAMACVVAMGAGVSWGGGDDIAITQIGGRVVTGYGDHNLYPGEYEFPGRVYGADLFEQGGLVFTDEPGWLGPFDNVGGGFAPGTRLGFSITAGLREWNGDDFLGGISTNRMRLVDSGAGINQVLTPLVDEPVAGFAVVQDAAVHALGGFDEHPFYELVTDRPGIYLLELEIWASDPLVEASDPLWIVFNWDSSELEHDEAIGWVEANLVPAPGALAVVCAAALAGGARRRRL